MSDENINPNPEIQTLPPASYKGESFEYKKDIEGNFFVSPEPNVSVYQDTLGGGLKGLLFHYVQFVNDENPQEAVEKAVAKLGVAKVLSLLNQAVRTSTTAKVRNSRVPKVMNEKGDDIDLQETAKAIDALKANAPLLFTVEQAMEYVPGDREKTPQALAREAAKAAQEGNLELFTQLFEKAQALMEQQKEIRMAAGVA